MIPCSMILFIPLNLQNHKIMGHKIIDGSSPKFPDRYQTEAGPVVFPGAGTGPTMKERSKPGMGTFMNAPYDNSMSSKTESPPASRTRRRRWFIALYPLYLLIVLWVGVQFFWTVRERTTGQSQQDVWGYYYRKLPAVRDAEVRSDDKTVDILLLGGSVLEQVAPFLETAAKRELTRPVRVFSVCTSAHTSRDSYLKFTQLEKQHFDLVVICHGINDARMNCVRDDLFRDDYTHCVHYNSLQRAVKAGSLTITGLIRDRLDQLIPLGEPEPDLVDFGKTIKTRGPFRQNLEGIVNAARSRSSRVMLMTFAFWLPADYSKERFLHHQLGYGRGRYELPAEVWGKPENVIAAIEAHNEEIRKLARRDDVIFIDQERELPHDGRHFADVCHLTDRGCEKFVQDLLPAIKAQFPAGTKMHYVAHFDNSQFNLANPDPNKTVTWGDQTWNEMMIGYFDIAVPVEVVRPDQEKAAQDRAAALLNRYDQDQNGQIERSEPPKALLGIFDRLDQNGDKILTEEELLKAAKLLPNLR